MPSNEMVTTDAHEFATGTQNRPRYAPWREKISSKSERSSAHTDEQLRPRQTIFARETRVSTNRAVVVRVKVWRNAPPLSGS